jgi:acetyl esterase
MVYSFGGARTVGSIATSDSVARRLANSVPAVVVSEQYRLAPEHPCLAGLADCLLVVARAWRNADAIGGDPSRIAAGEWGRLRRSARWLRG